MNKRLIGFTLAEVMVSLTIIAIIMMFYIPVHRTVANQYTTMANAVFDNLNLISKELMLNQKLTIGSDVTSSTVDQDGKPILNTDDTIFCKHIVNIVNSSGEPRCGAGQFYSVSGTTPNLKLSSLNFDNPNFKTTNGHRYYLSSHQTKNDNISSIFGYRVIGVDLNGKKGPNVEEQASGSSRPADLVYFLWLDNGMVLPLGAAATNRNYLNTRVRAYYYRNIPEGVAKSTGCGNLTQECSYKNNALVCEALSGDKQPGECNFGVEVLSAPGSTEPTYGYKDSYCLKNGDSTLFSGYSCGASSPSTKCSPSSATKADECVIDVIKPIYRVKI